MEDDFNNFLQFIEKDIDVLNENIRNLIYIPLDDLETSFSIDYELFVELTKNFVFKDNEIILEFPAIKEQNNKEYEISPLIHTPIPGDHLELFDKIFTSRFNGVRYIFFQGYFGDDRTFNYKKELYYRFFYALYQEYMKGSKDLRSIFNELLEQWKLAIEQEKMSVTFQIPISEFRLRVDILDSKKFQIKRINHTRWKKTINGIFPDRFRNSLLLYHSELSIRIFPSQNGDIPEFDKRDKEFQSEFSQISNKLRLFACAFYLNNLGFKYKDVLVRLPWWFYPEPTNYDKFEKEPISVRYQKDITQALFNEILKTYNDLKNSEIFTEPFQLLADNYFRIFQNYSEDMATLSELIVCSAVVLETLFTQGGYGELKFRFSLNAALFTCKRGEDLQEINRFFRLLYDLRSLIVHGDKKVKKTWYDKLINFIQLKKDLTKLYDWIEKLKKYVNFCLNKLIILKLNEPRIMTQIEKDPFFFIDHSDNYKKQI